MDHLNFIWNFSVFFFKIFKSLPICTTVVEIFMLINYFLVGYVSYLFIIVRQNIYLFFFFYNFSTTIATWIMTWQNISFSMLCIVIHRFSFFVCIKIFCLVVIILIFGYYNTIISSYCYICVDELFYFLNAFKVMISTKTIENITQGFSRYYCW